MALNRIIFLAVIVLALAALTSQQQRFLYRDVSAIYKKNATLFCGLLLSDIAGPSILNNMTNSTFNVTSQNGTNSTAPPMSQQTTPAPIIPGLALWSNVSFYKTTSLFPAQNTSIDLITQDPTKFLLNQTMNTLTILSMKRPEIESIYFCNSSSSNITIVFNTQAWPFIYIPERSRITASEGSDLELACELLFGNANNQTVTWQWFVNGVPVNSSRLVQTDTQKNSKLYIRELSLAERGTVECYAFNAYGNASQPIELRVKSSLAPLWPFLGVIGESFVFLALLKGCGRIEKKVCHTS